MCCNLRHPADGLPIRCIAGCVIDLEHKECAFSPLPVIVDSKGMFSRKEKRSPSTSALVRGLASSQATPSQKLQFPTNSQSKSKSHSQSPEESNIHSLSAHVLHTLPHLESRHHHFFEILMHFPRVPPLPANCSSLGVLYTNPSLQVVSM